MDSWSRSKVIRWHFSSSSRISLNFRIFEGSRLTMGIGIKGIKGIAMQQFTLSLVLALSFLSSTVQHAEGVTTVNSTTGGYTFTIAINGSVPQPDNDADLASMVEEIRTSIQDFSLALFDGARGSFHVEAVKLVMPAAWNSISTLPSLDSYPYAETDSYSNADIRLSRNLTHPRVSNTNQCGLPGKFIELPADFFTNSSKYELIYGSKEKALLTLWARFRWGVWEEHGYPSVERFPYFYRTDPKNESSWEATGCSDIKLEGDFKNSDDKICFAPDEACRFHPALGSDGNNATSSLMGFHWLETVVEFCGEVTHNKLALNKQNLFCNYRSVWEVIEASPDFQDFPVEDELETEVWLEVLRENPRPVFHLLLYRGFNESEENEEIMEAILTGLAPLFNEASTTVGAVTVFSSIVDERPLVENLVPWKKIGDNLEEFMEALENFQRKESQRDFTVGLAHVIDSIQGLNPAGGAIVLVVKSGATETYFDSLQFSEEEILASANASNTRIFAAEIRHSPQLLFVNLGNIADATGGRQEVFENTSEAPQKIQDLVDSILELLEVEFEEEYDGHVFFKGKLTAGEIRTVRLPTPKDIENLKIHLTLPASYDPVLRVDGVDGLIPLERAEWDEENDFTRRIVRTYTIPLFSDELEIQFCCRPKTDRTETPKCSTESTVADLLVIGDLYDHPFASVEVHMQTNAAATGNRLDFAADSTTPFVIHASVNEFSKPVTNLAVVATITNEDEDDDQATVLLKDEGAAGEGSGVDVQAGDGIYSGAFVPDRDGVYRISVQIETVDTNRVASFSNEFSRLLPVDQKEIACNESECGGISLEPFFYVRELEDVTFVNVQNFTRGIPSKIIDFSVVALHQPETADGDILLRLTFTSPSILGVSNSSAKSSKYVVLGSDNWDALYSFDPSAERVQVIMTTQAPGSTEIDQQIVPSARTASLFRYYVVYAFYSDFPVVPNEHSVKSNIAHLVDKQDDDYRTSTSTQAASTSSGEPSTTFSSLTVDDGDSEPSTTFSSSTVDDDDGEPSTTFSSSTVDDGEPTLPPTTPDPEESPETETESEPASSSTELPDDDDKKPFFRTTGGIVVIAIIVLIGIAAVGGIGFYILRIL